MGAEAHTDEPKGVHANVNKSIRAIPLLSIVSALVLFVASPSAVKAECWGTWPEFGRTARAAQDVPIVRIAESLREDSASYVIFFRLEVIEILRGSEDRVQAVTIVSATVPSPDCTAILRARVGDVFAIALNARVPGYAGQANSVALIDGKRVDHPDMVDVRRLSPSDVRGLLSMPDTATAPRSEEAQIVPATLLFTLGLLALSLGLRAARVRVGRSPQGGASVAWAFERSSTHTAASRQKSGD